MSLSKLHPRLQDYVKDKKWGDLTPIQKKAFDPIYKGQSCILEAPTSGGKTEAVLFPLLTRITANKSSGFKVLYIAPLKALLNDLALRVVPYAKMCYLEAFKWHGDVNQGEKIKQMNFPSDILLTTPESIEAILLRKPDWRHVFNNLETIVIDEAHYFALTERGSHLVSLLERIETEIEKRPQRIGITATIGNPNELLAWLLNNHSEGIAINVDTASTKERDFMIHYYHDEGIDLQNALYKMLFQKKSIVFERSRSATEETASRINAKNLKNRPGLSIKVKTHHSSVSKRLREDAENSIKQQTETSINAIISTSTLELGIDIGELDQVIQIGSLNSSASFLQRVGRTGRRIDRAQFFRGLCADPDELILLAACVNLGLQRISENILFPRRAFHILAHQIICLCLQQSGVTADYIWHTISRAYCFSNISQNEFNSLISHMLKEDFLRDVGRGALMTGDKTEEEFLRANWKRLFAIFDTGPMYNVVDGKKIIGTLDSGFARVQKLPFVFVLGGQEWNTVKLDHVLQQVRVEKNKTGIAPKWKAIANYDIPFELAQEVGNLLTNNVELAFLDTSAKQILLSQRNSYCNIGWKSGKWILDLSSEDSKIHLWTFCGDKINRTISLLLSTAAEELPDYDHMKVVISPNSKNLKSKSDFKRELQNFKTKSSSDLGTIIEERIEIKWFSKFSECLPEPLAKKTIIEKGMDINGLLRELNNTTIF